MNWGRPRLADEHPGDLFEHPILGVQGEPVVIRKLDQRVTDLALRPAGRLGAVRHSI